MKATIIGAGIGGLSAACLLSARGHEVTVVEKNEQVGGKMSYYREKGYYFDTGPSLFTMPEVLDRLFKECGSSLEKELEILPLELNCRYFFSDGTQFDNYSDLEKTLEEIRKIEESDAASFREFLKYSRSLYEKTKDAFIFNPLYDRKDLKNLDFASFLKIDAFSTVHHRVKSYFQSPQMIQFLDRFTTYNGSSPYQAPATLNVIPHIELERGGFYIKGGLYSLATSLYDLSIKLGVNYLFNNKVEHISSESGRVTGIHTENNRFIPSDLVIANSDASETILNLLSDEQTSRIQRRKTSSIEPSCSGYVLLLGVNNTYDQLQHHNIFFSGNYEQEFHEIFELGIMPVDPTIYVTNTSLKDPDHAPEGSSNLFILVNAPYLRSYQRWDKDFINKYNTKIIQKLENAGLHKLGDYVELKKNITPRDFYDRYLSNKGSIYGTSSNNMFSAFLRPRNKSSNIEGLYFTGGSTHPGGGIPLAIQSAFNATELIKRYEKPE